MLKDVSNMIAKMRRNSYTSPDDNVCVMEVLQDFSESLGNLANVFRDADTKLTSCIIFQTNLMRPMTRLFPERDNGFTKFEKLHVRKFLTTMVRTSHESEFTHCLEALEEICAGKAGFMEHFKTNWLSCKERWCTFLLGYIPHLDNNTIDKLEASWGAAKAKAHGYGRVHQNNAFSATIR
ncbi:hypothetical protein F443_23105 [Phytophthora nicotianae P1569]|uniref:Uncharacterized protein n=3 Tax=Phytophthora nicotianae TaxID=4792 RepID=V9DUT4_PHYNI|nr:hypothetical protein F443_23105 [Phytophthora nicotianae P1569]